MHHPLPLPPYGRILNQYQFDAISLEFPIYIFVGRYAQKEAYIHKRNGALASFIPPHKSFDDYFWPIKNQKVVLFDTGSSTVMALNILCYKILHLGAISVCRYSEMAPIEVFRQSNINKEIQKCKMIINQSMEKQKLIY